MPPAAGHGGRGGRSRPPDQVSARQLAIRRAWTLLGLTLVAPGSAQLARHSVGGQMPGRSLRVSSARVSSVRVRLGRVALRTWGGFLVLIALLALAWLVHREIVLGLFTHQFVLRPLAVLLIAAGVGWPLLALDAWLLGRSPQLPTRSRRWLASVAATMAVLTCALPIATGRRIWAGADLLGGVFTSNRHSAAADGRYNVLLLGGDAGPDRVGTRPDSMTLASIDTTTGRTALISLPRNLQNVPFLPGTPAAAAMPHGWSCGDTCLLNAIYTWGSAHPQYFPGVRDPGAEAMKQVVQAVTGLKVNYYVLIDLQGFRSMIDAVGGIDVDVVSKTPIGGETTKVTRWIEPGEQHLNGFHALWYARSRSASSDYDRMARQRCVMTAMVNQLDPATLLRHFQQIAAAGPKVVSTDIPAADLPQFLHLGELAKSRKIESLQLVPPLIVPRHPDYGVIRARVAALIADSEAGADESSSAATGSPKTGSAPSKSTKTPSATVTTPGSATASPGSSAPGVDVRQVCKAA